MKSNYIYKCLPFFMFFVFFKLSAQIGSGSSIGTLYTVEKGSLNTVSDGNFTINKPNGKFINNGRSVFRNIAIWKNDNIYTYKNSSTGERITKFLDPTGLGVTYTTTKINGNGITNFYTLFINKVKGIDLQKEIHVFGNLSFTKGIVNESGRGLVILESNSVHSNTKDKSHVKGKVRKKGNDNFTFPIGNGTFYRPASITAPKNETDVFDAQYFYKNPNTEIGNTTDGTVVSVTTKEYWKIERISGNSKPKVTLTWDVNKTSLVANKLDEIVVVRWDAVRNKWVNEKGIATGNTTSGTITASVTGYGYFTFAKLDKISPTFTKDCSAIGDQIKEIDNGTLTYTHTNTNWDVTATDNSGITPTITYTLTGVTESTGLTTIKGVVFKLGKTKVTATSIDKVGNTVSCTYDVTVRDTTIPTFTKDCSAIGDQAITLALNKNIYTHTNTNWDVMATDNSGIIPTITYTLTGSTVANGITTINGVSFNLGKTVIDVAVKDGSGNTATCSYVVEVKNRVIPVDPNNPTTNGYYRITFAKGKKGELKKGAKDIVGKFTFDIVKNATYNELKDYKPSVINVDSDYNFDAFNDKVDGSGNDYPIDLTVRVTVNKDYTAQYLKNIVPVKSTEPLTGNDYVRITFDKGSHGKLIPNVKANGKVVFDVLKNITINLSTYEPNIKPNAGYRVNNSKWKPVIKASYNTKITHIAQYKANDNTRYKVEHYKQNTANATYSTTPTEVENLTGTTNTTVIATPKVYTGFTVDYTVSGTVKEGVIKGDGSLVLKLYYKDSQAPDNNTTKLVIDNVTDDNVINGKEAIQNIPVTGTVTGEFKENDVVTLKINGKDFTGSVDANGKFSITALGADLAADNDTTIEAKIAATDAAGNVGEVTTTKSYEVKIDVNGGVYPDVIITEDINNDGFINKEEMSSDNLVDVKVEFNKDKVAINDTVIIILENGATKTITITVTDKSNGYITTDFPSTGHGTTMTIKAKIIDNVGNETPEGKDSAKIDISNLNGVKIEITSDENNDGILNKAEFGDGKLITTKITLPEDAVAGDKLFVTLSGTSLQEVILSQGQIDAKVVNLTFDGSSNGDGSVIKTTAKVTDAASNKSNIAEDNAVVKFDTLTAPNIKIVEDNNPDDEWLNKEELNGAVEVTAEITLPQGTVAGDKVIILDNAGNRYKIVLTPAQVTTGKVTQKFPTPAEGKEIIVEAYVNNIVGNPSFKATDRARVDTSDLSGVILTITTDDNNDAIINKAELEADNNKVKVTIKLPTKAEAGDVIKITMTGNADTVRPLTPSEIKAKEILLEYSVAANGTNMIAKAQVTDKAQNTSNEAKDNAVINTNEPGAPTVDIKQDNKNREGEIVQGGDGYINESEKGDNVAVKVTTPSTAEVGDTIVITDNAGNTFSKVLTGDDFTNGVTTSFPNPAEGSEIVVEAQVVNKAGTPSPKGNDKAILDTTNLKGVTITITTDTNNDELINKAELTADNNKVKVTIGLSDRVDTDDTLVITMTDNTTQTIILTPAQITAKEVVLEFNPSAEGTKMIAMAKVTDVAGNVSNESTDEATISTEALAGPKVTIREDNNPDDGYINVAELAGSDILNIDIMVPAGSKEGNKIVIFDNFGNTRTITLTKAQTESITSVSTTLPAPAHKEEIIVKVIAINKAGNKSKGQPDSAIMDLTKFIGLAIEITEDKNNDGYISEDEFEGNDIDVRTTIPKGAEVGDIITVTGSSNSDQTFKLTQKDIANKFINIKFATAPVDKTTFITTAIIVDIAGNTTLPVLDQAEMLLSAPKNPIVKIEDDKNNDGYINANELDTNNDGVVSEEEAKYIDVSVILPEKAEEKGVVQVTTNNGYTYTKTLTDKDIAKGSVSVPNVKNPGEGNTLMVKAFVKDKAGNLSEPGTDSVIINTTVPSKPIVKINDGGDNNLNKAEIDAGVTVTVMLPTDAEQDDVINVDTNSDGITDFTKKLTPEDITNGITFTITTNISTEGTLTVTAKITNKIGNVSDEGIDTSEIKIAALNAPVVEILDGGDGFINKNEKEDGVKVEITLPEGVKPNDTLNVDTNNDGKTNVKVKLTDEIITKGNLKITVPNEDIKDGKTLIVKVAITDSEGNIGKEGTDSSKVDITLPNKPIVEIQDGGDGVLEEEDKQEGVKVKIILPEGTEKGDTVNVDTDNDGKTDVTVVVEDKDFIKGEVTVTVPEEDVPNESDEDTKELVVGVTITDKAGNAGKEGKDNTIIPKVLGVSDCTLKVYNEFSPNNDGVGDTLQIDCIEKYNDNSIEVFNRWGNKVYSARGYQNKFGWNGVSNVEGAISRGKELPEGTYFYVLNLGDGSPMIKGWIYINR